MPSTVDINIDIMQPPPSSKKRQKDFNSLRHSKADSEIYVENTSKSKRVQRFTVIKPAGAGQYQKDREEQEFQSYYAHEKEIYMGLISSSSDEDNSDDLSSHANFVKPSLPTSSQPTFEPDSVAHPRFEKINQHVTPVFVKNLDKMQKISNELDQSLADNESIDSDRFRSINQIFSQIKDGPSPSSFQRMMNHQPNNNMPLTYTSQVARKIQPLT